MGICKALFEMDDEARAARHAPVLDREFIAGHTHGFEAFESAVRSADWLVLEHNSGLTRYAMEAAAARRKPAKALFQVRFAPWFSSGVIWCARYPITIRSFPPGIMQKKAWFRRSRACRYACKERLPP
jgi:hypothetical protein